MKISKATAVGQEIVTLSSKGKGLRIRHNFWNQTEMQKFAKIDMQYGDIDSESHIDCQFPISGTYQKMIPLDKEIIKKAPFYKKLYFLDYGWFAEEIEKKDPQMFTFIQEVREKLTLQASGITPVCLYDKIANLCFYDEIEKFKLDFVRANNTEVALETNKVLKKLM